MKIVLIGPPGVGKGTQAILIAEEFGMEHFSTGDIFREILKGSSELSLKLERYVNKGELVPDDIVFETVKETISKDESTGWVLDGYPRNKDQAELLDSFLKSENGSLDYAICLKSNKDVLIERLSSRRVCSNCGAIYNLQMNPPKEKNTCDECGETLIQRKDDVRETVEKRILIFLREFTPLYKYYCDQGIIREVNSDDSVGEVFGRVKDILSNG